MKFINGYYINDLGEQTVDVFRLESNNIGHRINRNYNFTVNSDPNVANIYVIRLYISFLQLGQGSIELFDNLFKRLDNLSYSNNKDFIVFLLDQEASSSFNTQLYELLVKVRPNYSLENIYFADEKLNDRSSSAPLLKHLNFVSQCDLAHNVNINHNIIKDKIFLSMNRRVKYHRLMLVGRLIEEGLMDKSLVSFFPDCEGSKINEVIKYCPYINATQKNNYYQWLNKEYVLDSDHNAIQENLQPTASMQLLELHKRSYFSIICETRFDEPEISVTEKTYKSIAHKHPFIIISNAHFLKHLKSLGYKTFHHYINESYDDIEDHQQRFESIIVELKRLAALPTVELNNLLSAITPIIEHNYRIHNNNFSYIDGKITSLFPFIDRFEVGKIESMNSKFITVNEVIMAEEKVKTSQEKHGILKLRKRMS